MACSSPAAPAMVSRSDSVQAARPSRWLMEVRSSAAPPEMPRQAKTSSTEPTATTGHWVKASTTVPRMAAIAVLVESILTSSRRRSRDFLGRGRMPYRARKSR